MSPFPTVYYGQDTIQIKSYKKRRDQLLSIIQQESNHLCDSTENFIQEQIEEIIGELQKQVRLVIVKFLITLFTYS